MAKDLRVLRLKIKIVRYPTVPTGVKGTEKNIWKGLRMVFERYTENRK
jgi:hypothetical protein